MTDSEESMNLNVSPTTNSDDDNDYNFNETSFTLEKEINNIISSDDDDKNVIKNDKNEFQKKVADYIADRVNENIQNFLTEQIQENLNNKLNNTLKKYLRNNQDKINRSEEKSDNFDFLNVIIEMMKPYLMEEEILNIQLQNSNKEKIKTLLEIFSKKLINVNRQNKKKNKEIESLRNKNQKLIKIFKNENTENKRLKNELKLAEDEKIKLKNDIKEEIREKDKEIELLKKNYESLVNKNNLLKKDNESLLDNNELLKKNNISLMNKNESLEKDNKSLMESNELLKYDVISFSSENILSNVGFLNYSIQEGNINYINGAYEGTGRVRLLFPKKGTITLKVTKGSKINSERLNKKSMKWKYYPQALNAGGTSCSNWSQGIGKPFSMAYKNGVFVVISYKGFYSSCSNDGGVTWKRGTTLPYVVRQLTASDGYFVGAHDGDYIFYSKDGMNWNTCKNVKGYKCQNQDISWDGKVYFSTNDNSSLCTTNVLDGSSGWTTNGKSNRITSSEQFKYGGGYYVKKGSETSSELRYSSDISHNNYHSYTLPWSRKSALNYGPGYWIILTQYGDLMISTDASASSWEIIDGSTSNTTSSSLYSISGGKDNWTGICYGDYNGGCLVAYTMSGDVAVLNLDDPTSSKSIIKFSFLLLLKRSKKSSILKRLIPSPMIK